MALSPLSWFAAAALGVTAVGGGLFASALSQPEVARPAATVSASASPGDDTLPILVPAGSAAPSSSESSSSSSSPSATASPSQTSGVDDKGGLRDRENRVEVGDDRDARWDDDRWDDDHDDDDDDRDDDHDDDDDDKWDDD